MSTPTLTRFRIGELARRVGATARTVRYYEELGLLPDREREYGRHRLYDEQDEARLRELLHVRELLGLSLAELRAWTEADAARAELRERWHAGDLTPEEQARIAAESLEHLATQIGLVRARRASLEELEDELTATRRRVRALARELKG